MSYILDALRKADAERERDPSRGIHARPLGTLPGLETPRRPSWLWAVMAVVAVALAAVAWRWFSPSVPPVAEVPAAAPSVVVVQAPALAPAVLPAPVVVAPPVAPVPPRIAPTPVPAPAPAPREERKAPGAQPQASPPMAAASAPVRILPASELPPDLPKLAISGGVYSDNPAQRMLIVNGQVVNEGAQLAPGMVLEQIRARSAVVIVRGQRYSMPF